MKSNFSLSTSVFRLINLKKIRTRQIKCYILLTVRHVMILGKCASRWSFTKKVNVL